MKRVAAVAGAVLLARLLLIPLIPGASAAAVQATYQARYGSFGTVTVRQFSDGKGAAIVHLHALVPGRTYAFRLASGRCTGLITPLIAAQTLTVSSAGTIGRTRLLSVAQVGTMAPLLSSARVVAVLTSSTSRLCRTLYGPSAFEPGPTQTPGPGATPSPTATLSPTPSSSPTPSATSTPGITANVSAVTFGAGPLLTPATMANWFPALKVGVAASATATVAPGRNVYALLVIPSGGSLAFTVTTNSGSGGWYWQWDPLYDYWDTPEHYFGEGQFFSLSSGTWAFGLDSNVYAGSETLTIDPSAITP